jgi:hypothetical protein
VKSYDELIRKLSPSYNFVQNLTTQNAVQDYLHELLIADREQLSIRLSKIFRAELSENVEAQALYR